MKHTYFVNTESEIAVAWNAFSSSKVHSISDQNDWSDSNTDRAEWNCSNKYLYLHSDKAIKIFSIIYSFINE